MAKCGVRMLAIVLISSGLSGCASPEKNEAQDPAQGATSSAAISSPSAEATPTEEGPAPATGAKIKVKGMTVNLPADWEAGPLASTLQATGYPKAIGSSTVLSLFRFTQVVASLDQLARANARRSDWKFQLKRQKDLTVDGQVVVHVAGKSNRGEYVEIFSTIRGGEELDLNFTFGKGEPKTERDEIIQSVLATWKFTG